MADVPVIQHAQGERPGQVSQLGSLMADMEEAGYPEPWPTGFRTLLGGPNGGMNLRNNFLHDLSKRDRKDALKQMAEGTPRYETVPNV